MFSQSIGCLKPFSQGELRGDGRDSPTKGIVPLGVCLTLDLLIIDDT